MFQNSGNKRNLPNRVFCGRELPWQGFRVRLKFFPKAQSGYPTEETANGTVRRGIVSEATLLEVRLKLVTSDSVPCWHGFRFFSSNRSDCEIYLSIKSLSFSGWRPQLHTEGPKKSANLKSANFECFVILCLDERRTLDGEECHFQQQQW